MTNDPIADFIVRLQNASRAGHALVSVPHSRMKHSIAKILEQEGYVGEVEKKDSSLSVSLLYKNGRPAIAGVKRVSKPSRRVYKGVRDLHAVKRGHGLLFLSTPAGVMTVREAKQKRAGGEALFEIW